MKIGILTSGGDCAGLNAAVGAVTIAAAQNGIETLGIRRGSVGLMGDEPDYISLNAEKFTHDLMHKPSTFLGTTNKGNPFQYPDGKGAFDDRSDEIIRNIKKLGIDTLIGIGGDGSLEILHNITEKGGVNLIWIPKTIDNDVDETELAVGFYSAVSTANNFLNNLHATAQTHDVVMITEIMGRDAGHLALHSGLAASADIILIPEIPYNLDAIVKKYQSIKESGRNYAQIVVSEAVKDLNGNKVQRKSASGKVVYGGIGEYLKAKLGEVLKAEIRVQSPGHTLRGCAPTAQDMILAKQYGQKAVELILQKKTGRMVAMRDGDIVDVDVREVAGKSRAVDVDGDMVHTARALNISFGDE